MIAPADRILRWAGDGPEREMTETTYRPSAFDGCLQVQTKTGMSVLGWSNRHPRISLLPGTRIDKAPVDECTGKLDVFSTPRSNCAKVD